jgi:hypothetical protein
MREPCGGKQPEASSAVWRALEARLAARARVARPGWSNACAAEQSTAQVLERADNAGTAACRLGEPGGVRSSGPAMTGATFRQASGSRAVQRAAKARQGRSERVTINGRRRKSYAGQRRAERRRAAHDGIPTGRA